MDDPITPEDIEREHRSALDSLTFEQSRALARVQRAVQISHFNHHRLVENLQKIFHDEAHRRNEVAARRDAAASPEAFPAEGEADQVATA